MINTKRTISSSILYFTIMMIIISNFSAQLLYAENIDTDSLIIKDSNDLQQTTKNYYSDINHSYDYYSGGLGDWISLIFSFTSNLSIILFFLFLSLSTVFYYIYRFIKIKQELKSIKIKKELRSGIPPKRKGLLGLLDTPTIQQLSSEITTPQKNIPGTDLPSNLNDDIPLTRVPM